LKQDFVNYNDQKKMLNDIEKEEEKRFKDGERYDHFPFTQGEILEQHRSQLSNHLRNEMQTYLSSKASSAAPS
jgi:hypothetical protein